MANEPAETTEELILPHQEVLTDFEENKTLDRLKDLNTAIKMQIGRIEKGYKQAFEDEDEKKMASHMASSKKLANTLLEFARVKKEKEEAASAEEEGNKVFNDLVEQADSCMTANDGAGAKVFYEQALALNTKDAHVQGQLALIEEQATNEAADAETQTKFEDHFNKAVALMEAGSLAEARSEYELALGVKPDNQAVVDRITEIDAHLTNDNGVGAISNSTERLVDIMNDIEKRIKSEGKITHQELIDIGLTKYPEAQAEFTIGKKEKHGKELTLVKSEAGIYKLKEKKTNWGLIVGVGVGIAAVFAAIYFITTGKKKQ